MQNDKNNEIVIEHEFLHNYLQYVENTESPTIMHIWSAIAGASACMGRHVCLPFGIGDIFPNVFVLLVGAPGTRKSQAIKYSSKLVAEHTQIRFAPDDTGGQRQGLITALEGDPEEETKEDLDRQIDTTMRIADMTNVEKMETFANLQLQMSHPEDRHTMFACASEFGTFMGEANANTTRFLNKVWDGEDYKYKLSKEQKVLKDPLMTIIGGTTTSDIARILPADAIGQGFMSRWILVFAPNKERKVARPTLDAKKAKHTIEIYKWLANEMRGEMREAPAAAELLDFMYTEKKIDLEDNRFIYYQERRHTHLMKLAMILAASRRSYVIETGDVMQADELLAYTEDRMPEALGEFGLSPVGAAKQKMIEVLQAAKEPITHTMFWNLMSRDMKQSDFKMAIADLIQADKIAEMNTQFGRAFVYKDDIRSLIDGLAVKL